MAVQVFISGVHTGAGLGVARALRARYPNTRLVGVSYAHPGEGILGRNLAETWTAGPWWLPGSAREAEWLAYTVGQHERILTPSCAALDAVRLPDVSASALLGLAVPPSIRVTATDWDLNTFGRRHGWRIWLRTTDGEDGATKPIRSWVEFQQARLALGERGFSDEVFLQRHVPDASEAIAFAAYHGELLGCVLRTDGPMAGGSDVPTRPIDAVPESLTISLGHALRELRWTGGGELQLVRDAAEQPTLLGWRACFPAWIYSAALAGVNLPARLLERATGSSPVSQTDMTPQVVRIVVEVPGLRQPTAHSSGPHTDAEATPLSRHALEVVPRPDAVRTSAPRVAEEILADVAAVAPEVEETPSFMYLPGAARRAFQHAEALSQRLSTADVRVRVAYSVKTNPDARLIELARATGLLAETISQLEVKKALACGVPADRIVLNGPAKRWRAAGYTIEPLHAVFCDSLEELRTAGDPCERGPYNAEIVGIRLRTPGFASRFGIPLRDDTDVATIGQLVRRLPTATRFGVHFHMASTAIGLDSWWDSSMRCFGGWCRSRRPRVDPSPAWIWVVGGSQTTGRSSCHSILANACSGVSARLCHTCGS